MAVAPGGEHGARLGQRREQGRSGTRPLGPSATSRDAQGWRLSDLMQSRARPLLVYEFTAERS